MDMHFLNCSAELIHPINLSGIEMAWKTSRPNDTSADLFDILQMDVPVNEFSFLQFELTAPIAVRELICSFRNHIVWARSSRVDDLNNWPLWNDLSQEAIDRCKMLHLSMKHDMETKHQDDFRRHIPLAYMTTFSFGMSFRDFVKFGIALTSSNNPMLHEVFHALLQAVHKMSPSNSAIVAEAIVGKWYKPQELFPPMDHSVDTVMGNFVSLNIMTSIQLRSQLIRHRAISFRDNFPAYLSPQTLHYPMSSNVLMQILMPMDFAQELIRKRSCWIAQTDLWAPLIEKLKTLVAHGKVMLPCDDGHCPFKRDNDLRLMGKDPSPPCPKAARIDFKVFTLEQKLAAAIYLERRPDSEFWKGILNVV